MFLKLTPAVTTYLLIEFFNQFIYQFLDGYSLSQYPNIPIYQHLNISISNYLNYPIF